MSSQVFDIAIVGAGPAGSACAITCAAAGLTVLVLEKSSFPRDKVCGDCLNPSCWPILQRLQVADRVRALDHARLDEVKFIGVAGRTFTCPLPRGAEGEIAVRRSMLDELLLERAKEAGARIEERTTVTQIIAVPVTKAPCTGAAASVDGDPPDLSREASKIHGWEICTEQASYRCRVLVAADGRNSTVARLLGLLPAPHRDRVGIQTHLPLTEEAAARVVMRFLPYGYCGLADVGGGLANLCLVSRPENLAAIKTWAAQHFQLPEAQVWHSIAPLARDPVVPVQNHLLLTGDAACVVEPFTGEGIYYALASGEIAARHAISGDLKGYAASHAQLYRGRLWVNHLARFACLHPRAASLFLRCARRCPPLLGLLTRKVVTPAQKQI